MHSRRRTRANSKSTNEPQFSLKKLKKNIPGLHLTEYNDSNTQENIERLVVKKLMNEPGAFVDQMLEGLLLAHPDQLKSVGGTNRALARADAPVTARVGIVTGGGAGTCRSFLVTWVGDWQAALPSGMSLAVQALTKLRPRPAASTLARASCTFTGIIPVMC